MYLTLFVNSKLGIIIEFFLYIPSKSFSSFISLSKVLSSITVLYISTFNSTEQPKHYKSINLSPILVKTANP